MTFSNVGVCTAWADELDDCPTCANVDAYEHADVIADMLLIASDVLYLRSGQRFRGECELTVQPCTQRLYPVYTYADGVRAFVACGCRAPSRCHCTTLSEIQLGVFPIIGIDAVRVDGATVSPDAYRVNDYRYLERIDGDAWPCCSAPGDFEVDVSFGQAPPALGVHAAQELACQLVQGCLNTGQCKLPARTVSLARRGSTVQLAKDAPNWLIGLQFCDLFLETYNPQRIRRRATVLSPGRWRRSRRLGSDTPAGS